jgi:hypothetical protein
MSEIDIYNLLNKVEISAVKTTQLNDMTSRVAVDKDAVSFWSSMITVARAIGESRTFAHGLPIYETGTVIATEIGDGVNVTYTPSGSEVWQILNIDLQGCTAALRDSDGNMSQLTSSTFQSGQLFLSSTMSIFFNNGSGGAATPTVAYLKVSL